MEELFYLLLLLLFFLAPVLERVLKGRRRGQQPAPSGSEAEPDGDEWEPLSERQERPRPEYGQPHGTTAGGQSVGGRQQSGPASAEDVIPDDLWEILTGERRRPRPEPDYEPEPEPEYEESAASYEPGFDTEDWRVLAEEPPATEPPRGRVPEPTADVGRRGPWGRPERVAPDELKRFEHKALPKPRAAREARMAPELQARPEFEWDATRRRRGPRLDLRLRDREELKRAVVLREVLGPPKGLADWDPHVTLSGRRGRAAR